MVEIFTAASGQSGAATRSVSNDVRLSVPSEVYFGSGVAGVAFYEKSGADLKVTLLDGQEVMVRDFFVIGPAGEYSRLRDGGSAGAVEVTGLIAPEPFVPADPSAQTAVAEVEEKAQTAQPSEALRDGETVVEVNVGGGEPAGADAGSSSGGDAGGGGTFFAGMPLDGAIFGASMFPAVGIMLRGGNDDDVAPAHAPVAAAAPVTAPEETVAEEPVAEDAPATVGTDAPADPYVADLLAAILDPDHAETDLFAGDTSPAPVSLLADAADGSASHDTGSDLLSALLGDLIYTPPEG
ncbi:hypothetical protein M3484_11215 [Pseudomonas sp. GX19020]|uniref:hypothetical protein n=1 Tax=Pseudomonadota TaxID=1224 RepID=UPI0008952763|nr:MULTISPECIES: hypothetical protein [Pseudomonadota]MCL4067140.1 hypothetical protein [Pseudomonas sp. GX19020]SED30825.1 hypothetical protein SAMN05519105_3851 [Rhodobacter sp. 24-YEA-8]